MSSESIDDFLRRTTLRQIEIMAALQRHGSITRAAQALGMSVANVSRASKRFEENLGVKLFEGDGRRSILRRDVSEILDCLDGLTKQIHVLRLELDQARQDWRAKGQGGGNS